MEIQYISACLLDCYNKKIVFFNLMKWIELAAQVLQVPKWLYSQKGSCKTQDGRCKPKSLHLVEKDTFCFSNLLVEGICLIESSLFLYFRFMCHFLLVLNSLRLSLFFAQSESAAFVNLVSLFLDFRFLIMLELFAWVALFGVCAAHRCCVGILWVRKSNGRHTNWPEVGSFFWHKSVHQISLHHMLVKCILMYTESKLDMKTWPRLFKLQRSGMKFFCSCKNAHNLKTQSTSTPMN